MVGPTAFSSPPSPSPSRSTALAALRHWLMRESGWSANAPARLPFGLCALDSHLPNGGLGGAALHEIVPATQAAFPAALGFATAVLARFISSSPDSPSHPHRRQKKIVFVTPVHALRQYGLRQCDRLCDHLSSHVSAHGLYSLGFDPRRAIIVNPAHRQDALWALVGKLAFARAASRRRHNRSAQSEDQPETASRRRRCRLAAVAAAAFAKSRIKCGGDALADRRGARRARPFRQLHARALAAEA